MNINSYIRATDNIRKGITDVLECIRGIYYLAMKTKENVHAIDIALCIVSYFEQMDDIKSTIYDNKSLINNCNKIIELLNTLHDKIALSAVMRRSALTMSLSVCYISIGYNYLVKETGCYVDQRNLARIYADKYMKIYKQ